MEKIYLLVEREEWQNFVLPIVLIATGLILLSGDFVGLLSLDRVVNLWPIAVITVGLADLLPPSTPSR